MAALTGPQFLSRHSGSLLVIACKPSRLLLTGMLVDYVTPTWVIQDQVPISEIQDLITSVKSLLSEGNIFIGPRY